MPKDKPPPTDAWLLILQDESDVEGFLAYHDVSEAGWPLAKVFVKSIQDSGESWTLSASHELLVLLANPKVNLTVYAMTSDTNGMFYTLEVADPCQPGEFGYKIDEVLVSDFIYPAWFEPKRDQDPVAPQFDYGSHIKHPLQILKGGYIDVYDPKKGWKTLNESNKSE